MQELPGLVSVIIPAYNAETFLQETISSVKAQTYTNWEIIVVNDGSTDHTAELAAKEAGPNIKVIGQRNAGVSAARNKGLSVATGEYVVFLDADDILTPRFIESRVEGLREEPSAGFIGGLVETFPSASPLKTAIGDDPEKDILFFNAKCATIPSNYLFKKKILLEKHLLFNERLSSTADRFFLLLVSRHSKGKSNTDLHGRLLYRVNEGSMSHSITPRLIRDNEQFYRELVSAKLLPVANRSKFKCLYFLSLALGFLKIRYFWSFLRYFFKSAIIDPLFFLKLLRRRLFKGSLV